MRVEGSPASCGSPRWTAPPRAAPNSRDEERAFSAENVYLFCASEGLATVVRASIDKAALAKILQLRQTQVIVLAQTVGVPKK